MSQNKDISSESNISPEGEERSSFSGKIGFVLAAAGSAVGLGNIWRFPYLAAQYGGGIFLLVYIILALTFGSTVMLTEIAIGRRTGQSPIGAFKSLAKRSSFIGMLASVVPMLILPYYSVIGGWVSRYAFGFMTGEIENMTRDSFFSSFISSPFEPVMWFSLFIAATTLIVLFGVEKGIEKVSKIMMPALVVLMLFIVIYSFFTVENVWDGVLYYITPDFSKFTYMTVVAAMGQLFYSMSLAMGIMITFGSYMKKSIGIKKSVRQIEIFDTGIAFLAGLMIIPACIAFDPDGLTKGPGLMFGVLPKVFSGMFGGSVVGSVFFLMVLLAALTSSISLMETIVASIQDKWKIGRRKSCLTVLGISLALGLLSCFGYSIWNSLLIFGKFQVLDFFDFVTNSVMMPIIALLTCILIGYIIDKKPIIDEIYDESHVKSRRYFTVMLRYVVPVCLVVILVFSVLEGVGAISV